MLSGLRSGNGLPCQSTVTVQTYSCPLLPPPVLPPLTCTVLLLTPKATANCPATSALMSHSGEPEGGEYKTATKPGPKLKPEPLLSLASTVSVYFPGTLEPGSVPSVKLLEMPSSLRKTRANGSLPELVVAKAVCPAPTAGQVIR